MAEEDPLGPSPPQITAVKPGHNTEHSYLMTLENEGKRKFAGKSPLNIRRIMQTKFPIFVACNLVAGKVVCRIY